MSSVFISPKQQNLRVYTLSPAELACSIYPDNQYSVVGVDKETGFLVDAKLAISQKPYNCVTCLDSIQKAEHHVIIGGLYLINKNGKVFDHHHAHTNCFREIELLYWSATALVSSSLTIVDSLASPRNMQYATQNQVVRAA